MTRIRTAADIGALIRDRRRALELGQADLANAIGVARLWVNQVEHGKPGASLGLVLRALAAVGVELTAESVAKPKRKRASRTVPAPDIDAIVAAARRKDRR